MEEEEIDKKLNAIKKYEEEKIKEEKKGEEKAKELKKKEWVFWVSFSKRNA